MATRCHQRGAGLGVAGPRVNKFEQVSTDGQQVSLVGGGVCGTGGVLK